MNPIRTIQDFIDEGTPGKTFYRKAKCWTIGAAPERWVIQKYIRGTTLNIGAGRDHIKGTISVDNLQHKSYTDWKVKPLIIADACNLPFKDGTVDCILAMHVYEHIPERYLFLDECSRVLREGGNLCLVLPNLDYLGQIVYWRDPTHLWSCRPNRQNWYITGMPHHLALLEFNRLEEWKYGWSFDCVYEKV